MDKPFFKSKTFWMNVIACGAMIIQSQTSFVIEPGDQALILGLVNLALRATTREGLTLS